MLFIYADQGSPACVKHLAESAKCVKGDSRLGLDSHRSAGRLVEHPQRDVETAWSFEVKSTAKDGLPQPGEMGKNEDLTPEPRMEWITDCSDIDHRGFVLRSSTTNFVPIKDWATGRWTRRSWSRPKRIDP
jgi:hypothetical protein